MPGTAATFATTPPTATACEFRPPLPRGVVVEPMSIVAIVPGSATFTAAPRTVTRWSFPPTCATTPVFDAIRVFAIAAVPTAAFTTPPEMSAFWRLFPTIATTPLFAATSTSAVVPAPAATFAMTPFFSRTFCSLLPVMRTCPSAVDAARTAAHPATSRKARTNRAMGISRRGIPGGGPAGSCRFPLRVPAPPFSGQAHAFDRACHRAG